MKTHVVALVTLALSSWTSGQAPVASYPLDGNAQDQSGGNRHGTLYGTTPAADRFGNPSGALEFDGVDDFVSMDATGLPTATRTVSVWFQLDSDAQPVLMSYGGGACGTSFFLALNGVTPASYANALYVTCHCDVGTLAYPYSSAPVGTWRHLAVSTAPTGTKMYLDGLLVASNATPIANTSVTGTSMALGVATAPDGAAPYTDVNVKFLEGKLDDLRIYARELSAAEIFTLGGNPCSGQPAKLSSGLDDFYGGALALDENWLAVGAWAWRRTLERSGRVLLYPRRGLHVGKAPEILAYPGANEQFFGYALSLSGTTLLVGAPGQSSSAPPVSAGLAYLYRQDCSRWLPTVELSTLLPAAPLPDDHFGDAVSVDGDLAVVGSVGWDSNGTSDHWAGRVHVFVRNPLTDTWAWEATLYDPDASSDEDDWFGHSLAVRGNQLVVGALRQNDVSYADGAVFVFDRVAPGQWNHVQTIHPPAGDVCGSSTFCSVYFGIDLALDGNDLIVGAPFYGAVTNNVGDPGLERCGAFYAYTKDVSGLWVANGAKVRASDATFHDEFGGHVALDGDTVLAGAVERAVAGFPKAGTVYLFSRSGAGGWLESCKLENPEPGTNDNIVTCAVEGELVVTASGSADAFNFGAAYLYGPGVTLERLRGCPPTPTSTSLPMSAGIHASLEGSSSARWLVLRFDGGAELRHPVPPMLSSADVGLLARRALGLR